MVSISGADQAGAGESAAASAGPAPAAAPGVASQAIEDAMLEITGRVTGYPKEMLTLDMDIENDLGIDSIKRVEILSVFEEEHPELPSAEPEDLAELRTLAEISAHLVRISGGGRPSEKETPSAPTAGKKADQTAETQEATVSRRVIKLVEAPPLSGKLSTSEDRPILVCGNDPKMGATVAAALRKSGLPAAWSDSEPADEDLADCGGLVLVAGMETDGAAGWSATDETFIKTMFDLVSRASGVLAKSAGADHQPLLAAVTALDGALGFAGGRFNPAQAALAGMIKTAAIEWENVVCRVVDVDPSWPDRDEAAAAVAAEIVDSGGPVERALTEKSRRIIELEAAACPEGHISLGSDDVVVVSGGARGVTAQCARTLARATGAAFVLLGRSPLPEEEPAWLADADSEADMKKRIMENEFSGEKPTPAAVEKAFKRYQAGREITATLEDLRCVCREAAYFPVDVRDEQALCKVFEQVRSSLGEITAVIHGAGVVDDKFIADKTREQFDRVFDTKVAGARALLSAVDPESLRYLVFFSSVAARMGNRGQVDYAMANEILNKCAQKTAADHPHCRVLAVNWGPWDGGMVTPSLKREFEKNNIDLIPLEAGSQCLLEEMAAPDADNVEVVIGAGFADTESESSGQPEPAGGPAPEKVKIEDNGYSTAFERDVSLEAFPVLKSHMLNKTPVVPFALAAEWVGSGALHANPGLRLTGIDDMRVRSGIKLNGASRKIAVMTEKARKKGDIFEVGVRICSSPGNRENDVNYVARAVLANRYDDPPVFTEPASVASNSYAREIGEVYADILFHGEDLYGIREIIGCSETGIKARVACAPSPRQWIAQPLRNIWLADPLVLDSAFQLAIVWSYENTGVRSLPVGFARFRQYRESFPSEGVTVVLEVKDRAKNKLGGDFTFLDDEKNVVARIEGYEAVMDKSLEAAFKG